MKLYQKIFSIIFILMLLGIAGVRFYYNDKTAEELFAKEMCARISNIMGKSEDGGFAYVKDKNGYIYSSNYLTYDIEDSLEMSLRIRRLKDDLKDSKTKVVFILYPQKYNEAWTNSIYGVPYKNYNEFADVFIKHLRRYNIDYIDLRENFIEDGLGIEDVFYKTDYRITTMGSFRCMSYIYKYLNIKFNAGLDPSGFYRDIDNYDVTSYEKIFLGKAGEKLGSGDTMLDDFQLITPKFETDFECNFTYRNGTSGSEDGDMKSAFLELKYLEYDNVYDRELGNVYLRGKCKSDEIVNNLNEDGPKALFIRDACSSPVAAFMAPSFSKIDMISFSNNTDKAIREKVNSDSYDYVFIAYGIDSLVEDGVNFYIEDKEGGNE